MTWFGYLARIVFSLAAFAGLVFFFAWIQNWIDRGLEEPPDSQGEDRK